MKKTIRNISSAVILILVAFSIVKADMNSLISSVLPVQNAININKATNITITFSQNMNTSTLNTSNIKIYGASSGYKSYTLTSSTTSVTMNPEMDFMAGEEISVILNSGIKSLSGDSLTPFGYEFTIAATQGSGVFTGNYPLYDTIPYNPTVRNIISGDIDGDSDIDLLALMKFGTRVYEGIDVLKRQSDGSYIRTQTFYSQFNLETSVLNYELKDMDNDGYPDAVGAIGDGIGPIIFVAYNDGSGNFTMQNISPLYQDILIPNLTADFDNDGDIDIVNINNDHALQVYSNMGNRQFSIINLNQNIENGMISFPCDFDNDGDMDIISSHSIFVNNGNLSFSISTDIPSGFTGVVKDFDSDGDLDMITSNPPQIFLHRNNGHGIFSEQVLITSANYSFSNIAEDFNADGSFDLLLFNSINNRHEILKNSGTGNFTLLSALDYPGFIPYSANDVDTDGDIDIQGKVGYRIFVLLNDSAINQMKGIDSVSPKQNAISVIKSSDIQVFFKSSMDASTINSSNMKVYGIQTGLLNCAISYDAAQKKAIINSNNEFKAGEEIQVTLSSGIRTSTYTPIKAFTWTFTVQALSGSGIFTETSIIDTSIIEGEFGSLVSGDLDLDGDLDLAVGFSRIMIYINNGNAQFLNSQIIDLTGWNLIVGDFDGDGYLDIVSNWGTLNFLRNNGNGNFENTSSSPGGGRLGDIGDLDEDGDLDIALFAQSRIKWYLNDGSGNFSERSIIFEDLSGLPPFLFNLSVGDLDNDGDLDMTSMIVQIHSPQYSELLTLYNDGNANFGIAERLSTNYFVTAVNADLEGDGDLDILSNSKLFFNNGSGIFAQAAFSSSTNSDIISGDFDGDGDIDAAFTNESSDNVRIFKNNSAGLLEFFSNSSSGTNPNQGEPGDYDGDGDIDLAVINGLGHGDNPSDISILENDVCTPPQCEITGADTVTAGSENLIYLGSTHDAYWDISNYDITQASILPGQTGDSVKVSAGQNAGHFVLYYVTPVCGTYPSCSKHIYVVNPNAITCTIFSILEGYYNVSMDRLNMRDTVRAYLRNVSAPYDIVDSSIAVIDSVLFGGSFVFTNAPTGTYYIVIRQRNGLETWSEFGGIYLTRGGLDYYDFPAAQTQAYGNNLTLKETRYCIFSGDVNQNGIIDLSDLTLVYNDVSSFASGYVISDLNGDRVADLSDMLIVHDNSSEFVSLKRP